MCVQFWHVGLALRARLKQGTNRTFFAVGFFKMVKTDVSYRLLFLWKTELNYQPLRYVPHTTLIFNFKLQGTKKKRYTARNRTKQINLTQHKHNKKHDPENKQKHPPDWTQTK